MLSKSFPSNETHRLRLWSYSGACVAVLIAIGVWYANQWGALRTVDGLAYDVCFRLKSRIDAIPAQVLLVYCDVDNTSFDERTVRLLSKKLQELGAKRVVFAFHTNAIVDDVENANVEGAVIIACESERDPADPRYLRLIGDNQRRDTALHGGIVALPPSIDGVYRRQQLQFRLDHLQVASLELVIAESCRIEMPAQESNEFRINYRGGAGSLPHVDAEGVLADNLVPGFVQGKVVLVGRRPGPESSIVATPTTTALQKMSSLEFHGHAVNTLLNRRAIHVIPPTIELMIVLLVTPATLLVYQSSEIQRSLLALIGFMAFETLAATLLLSSNNLWLPLVPMIVAQSVCFAVVYQRKAGFSKRIVQQVLVGLRVKNPHTTHSKFFSKDDPWPQIASFVQQSMHSNRAVFLELPDKSFHLNEVASIGCEFAEIAEQQRDYRQTPYSIAIELRGPLNLSLRDLRFFENDNSDEQQFLVPLLFGSELCGFIALGVSRQQLLNTPGFESRVRGFAEQIVELLYRRRLAIDEQKNGNALGRLLTYVPEEAAYAELFVATNQLQHRLAKMESLFEKSNTAVAVFDVFGRPMLLNNRMVDILQSEGHLPSEMQTADVIDSLTRRGREASRNLLHRVIVDKHSETMTIELGESQRSFSLSVRPLHLDMDAANQPLHEPSAFQTRGVVCELIDQSAVMELLRLKDHLTENMGNSLRNDLATVEMAAALLASEGIEPEQRDGCHQLIQEKVEQAVATLTETQKFLKSETVHDIDRCHPIEPVQILRAAVDFISARTSARRIKVLVERPDVTSCVYGNVERLRRAFSSTLSVLVSDARDGTQIAAVVEEHSDEVFFTFANQGFGMSIDQLRQRLAIDGGGGGGDSDDDHSDEFRRLRESVRWIDDWGGSFSATGQIGDGLSIKIGLRKFN